jgi:hypothetical protein
MCQRIWLPKTWDFCLSLAEGKAAKRAEQQGWLDVM